MTENSAERDPMPGIRAVLITGFVSGNACGLLYFLLSGHLFDSWWLEPETLLALFGTVLGIGMVGTMSGAIVGLSARLFLQGPADAENWWPPVILSGLMSAILGLGVAIFLVTALFETTN